MKNTMKYFGFYRGIVVQQLNNGFCRIEIPEILVRINDNIETLPFAEPAQALGGGDKTTGNGFFTYPEIGSVVWVFFEGGNIDRPVYFAMSNVKSPTWTDIVVDKNPKEENEKEDPKGHEIYQTSQISKFNRTAIKQNSIVDPKNGTSNADSIELVVDTIPEIDNLEAENADPLPTTPALPIPVGASIKLDNKNDSIKLTAKNSIILEAPHIQLSAGYSNGKYGSIVIVSEDILAAFNKNIQVGSTITMRGDTLVNISSKYGPVMISSNEESLEEVTTNGQ